MHQKKVSKLKHDIVFDADLRGQRFVFHTTWGLFSPTEIDKGSRMLIEELEVQPTDTTLEIGCGYGPIGLSIAKQSLNGIVHMVDKDFVAIDYAKKNAVKNGVKNCEIYLSNAFSNVPDMKFDLVVSNLPAKVGAEMLYIILTDAKARLKKGGKLYVVVIAGLKEYIKRNFLEVFGNFTKLKQGKTYMVAIAENV